jgi:tetratricopeptide (TPR) repeat protein
VEVSGRRAIGAQTIGVAISGDNARVVMLPAEAVHWAQTVHAPPGTGFFLESASGVFVGREQELTDLREMLTSGGSAAVVQSRAGAIHGLGGVGKSTLALHYADRYRGAYTSVWCITAESPESIVTGLAGIATRLCPHWAQTAGPDERAAWAITWLQAHPGWLLVFDNVEEPNHLRPYLGTLAGGHHLATSRKSTGWHTLAPTMALGLLPLDEATDLLCNLAFPGCIPAWGQREEARRLAEVLGCLPLALEQAGAYAYRTGIDLDTYRRALELVLHDDRDVITPERTIARIWDRTLTAVSRRDPLAVTLLYTMAWLAPDEIPRTLLAALAPSPIALGNALGELHAYNMIAFTADRQGVSIHRLVQTVLRTRTAAGSEPDTYALGRAEAEQVVRQFLTTPPGTSPSEITAQWECLLPHVLALAESAPTDGPASADTGDIYDQAAQYLHRQGRDAHTVPLHIATLGQRTRLLGDTHPDTMASRNSLANAHRAIGRPADAIPLYEATLAQREQVLGHTHPETLRSRSNLADAYWGVGDLTRAILLHEETLAQSEQVLGHTHPDTLHSRDHLAGVYESAGDLARAVHLFETTLAQREKVLGIAHPDTLDSRINLAEAYQLAGDLDRAISMFEAAMVERVRTLGAAHPATLRSRNYIARCSQAAGDFDRAISLYEATLTLFENVLGDVDPQTLRTRSDLASAYAAAGDLNRAISLYEMVLAQRGRVLGDAHPSTLTSRNNLAAAYQAAGDWVRAIMLHEATLAQRVRILGELHPDTLASRHRLAVALREAQAVGQGNSATPETVTCRQEERSQGN